MKMGTVYAVMWIVWLVAFLAIELSALWSGHAQWTLSEFVWRAEKLGHTWTFLRYFIAVFLFWLAGHLAFGWWR